LLSATLALFEAITPIAEHEQSKFRHTEMRMPESKDNQNIISW
jgi:hypothetical protein